MKKILYILSALTIGALALNSCSEEMLETAPTSSVDGNVVKTAEGSMIALNGIYRSMYTAGWSTTGNTHQCFGISAYNLMADVMGDDMIMASSGSGWFWYDAIYSVKSRYTSGAWRSYDLWNAYYTWVSNANFVIANEANMADDDFDMMYCVGQAYAIRAYSYFMLAQSFARTYKGHENEPCVPLYTEPTTTATEGKPRSTVQEVYTQITADITKAVTLLTAATPKTTLPEDKSMMTLPVALGVQARIALTMEDWATAAAAAEAVIDPANFKYDIVEVNPGNFKIDNPNFINSVSSANVIWGAGIIGDQVGMYASLFTHMSSTAAYGKRARKLINAQLYLSMPANDSRRCWWDIADPDYPLQQHKFDFSNFSTWMGDYVWMRVEEMYLTAAEAECMLTNDVKAQNLLTALVSTRVPGYTCTKTGTALSALTSGPATGSLREEIINQRRIELWGEYGRIYDIRRLKQGFQRSTTQGFPSGALLLDKNNACRSLDPESYMWVLTIPQAEFDGNKSLDSKTDQNPVGDTAE